MSNTPLFAPLIVTLRLDEAAFLFFDGLRQAHFPPERNFLKAHLTLFHHLPDTEEIRTGLKSCADGVSSPLSLQVTGLVKLGGGVAYGISCPPLQQIHKTLQQQWSPLLTAQDRQPLRPHITVQNKVTAAEAQKLYLQLQQSFTPFEASGRGFDLWAYKGGPWQWLQQFDFG
jgi:hypothetical protein